MAVPAPSSFKVTLQSYDFFKDHKSPYNNQYRAQKKDTPGKNQQEDQDWQCNNKKHNSTEHLSNSPGKPEDQSQGSEKEPGK